MKLIKTIFIAFTVLISITSINAGEKTVSAVFGGGPFYKNPKASIDGLRNSGFTTAIVWTIHIDTLGNFNFNMEFPLVKNGEYIGRQSYPDFAKNMSKLKEQPTSVNRVEFGLSAWGGKTFENIKNLIAAEGTGENSTLYKNFKVLKDSIPAIDALNFDDELTYDVESSVKFSLMLAALGYKVALCPYNSYAYWQGVAKQTNDSIPGTVDAIFLQCYAGGGGNTPCSGWDFDTIPVYPGLWSKDLSPEQVEAKLTGWNERCGIQGGFMWLYDEFVTDGRAPKYAAAINILGNKDKLSSNPNPAVGTNDLTLAPKLSWNSGKQIISHNIYLGTDKNVDFLVNQEDSSIQITNSLQAFTTYYWRVDEITEAGTFMGPLWSFTTQAQKGIKLVDRTSSEGTLKVRGQNAGSGETKDKLFNNNLADKWLDFSTTSYIQYQFEDSLQCAISAYTITSANDYPERDPLSWRLKGSNNGSDWNLLDTRKNIAFQNRFQTLAFSFENDEKYAYYKFDNLTNNGAETIQIAEIEFLNDSIDVPTKMPAPSPTPTAIIENKNNLNVSVYPNPFNSKLNVSISITQKSMVTITIYNLNGQKIACPANNQLIDNSQDFIWNPSSFTNSSLFLVQTTVTDLFGNTFANSVKVQSLK